jgi:hypothetical protein
MIGVALPDGQALAFTWTNAPSGYFDAFFGGSGLAQYLSFEPARA